MEDLRSTTRPEGHGNLAMRMLLHSVPGEMPFATHMEVRKIDGWRACSGNYFATEAQARADYERRCKRIEVTP